MTSTNFMQEFGTKRDIFSCLFTLSQWCKQSFRSNFQKFLIFPKENKKQLNHKGPKKQQQQNQE